MTQSLPPESWGRRVAEKSRYLPANHTAVREDSSFQARPKTTTFDSYSGRIIASGPQNFRGTSPRIIALLSCSSEVIVRFESLALMIFVVLAMARAPMSAVADPYPQLTPPGI